VASLSNWNQIALEGWLREVLRVQTHDAHVVLADGKTEAAVCLRGDSVCLVSYDDEETVLAKVRLVPA
jgi:hypothetical protein